MERDVIMGNWWPWKAVVEIEVVVIGNRKTHGVDARWKKWV